MKTKEELKTEFEEKLHTWCGHPDAFNNLWPFISKSIDTARQEGFVEGYTKGTNKEYLRSHNEDTPISYKKGREEAIEEVRRAINEVWAVRLSSLYGQKIGINTAESEEVERFTLNVIELLKSK
jgi:hypothetical protein